MHRGEGMGGGAAAEAGEGPGNVSGRGLVGRWPDADALLQGGMSEGLRDWDLWYVVRTIITIVQKAMTIPGC